jgi:hypothetical protein
MTLLLFRPVAPIGTGSRMALQGAAITGAVQAAAGAEIEVSGGGNLFDGSATPFTDISSVAVDQVAIDARVQGSSWQRRLSFPVW